MTNPLILGIDPGLANCGWCAVRAENLEVKRVGLIRTVKSDRKKGVRAAEDNVRRVRELCEQLTGEANRCGDVVAIAMEAKSHPPNSSSSDKTSLAIGAITALAYKWHAAIVQASPQDIKKVCCGDGRASKEMVQRAVQIDSQPGADKVPRKGLEHPADALGAIWACADSEVVRALRRRSA